MIRCVVDGGQGPSAWPPLWSTAAVGRHGTVLTDAAPPQDGGSAPFLVHRNGVSESFQKRVVEQSLDWLSENAPFAHIDAARGRALFVAHPLGRGTFYFATTGASVLVSTRLLEVCVALGRFSADETRIAEFVLLEDPEGTDGIASMAEGVQQVPVGCALVIEAGSLTVSPYWRPQDAIRDRLSFAASRDAVRTALTQATSCKSPRSHRAGVYFSGGLDSTVVATLAAAAFGGRVSLLTGEGTIDTPEEAQLRARYVRTSCLPSISLDAADAPDHIASLRRLNRARSTPGGSLFTGVDVALATAAIADGCDVLFSGMGGDELFAPSPYLLADLIGEPHSWRARYDAVALATALDADTRAWKTYITNGLLPRLEVKQAQREVAGKSIAFATRSLRQFSRRFGHDPALGPRLRRLLGEYADWAPLVAGRWHRELGRAVADGWTLTDYYHYRELARVPAFEPQPMDAAGRLATRVVSPLADPAVFIAASRLRLTERVQIVAGYEPKHLLREAVGTSLPKELRRTRKVGASDLLYRFVESRRDAYAALLHSPVLERLGIQLKPGSVVPDPSDAGIGLFWLNLLLLAIWLEESQAELRERLR